MWKFNDFYREKEKVYSLSQTRVCTQLWNIFTLMIIFFLWNNILLHCTGSAKANFLPVWFLLQYKRTHFLYFIMQIMFISHENKFPIFQKGNYKDLINERFLHA